MQGGAYSGPPESSKHFSPLYMVLRIDKICETHTYILRALRASVPQKVTILP